MCVVGLFWGGLDICITVAALVVLHAMAHPQCLGEKLEGLESSQVPQG